MKKFNKFLFLRINFNKRKMFYLVNSTVTSQEEF